MRRLLLSAVFCAMAGMCPAQAQDAVSLKARYANLAEVLASNQFQRPLYLESSEDGGDVTGDIYARISQPYAVVSPALQGMDHWCDILTLHQNVKGCRVSAPPADDTISLSIGRKFRQPLADAYRFQFSYAVVAARPDYLQLVLSAAEGPMGTSRYRIRVEAVELDAESSFVHLSYSYAYGLAARLASRLYLSTLGRSKVGFSIVGATTRGRPVYIGSTRGVVERNAMRCYLAIEAYLGALSVPAAERFEKRLNDWHAGIERYPAQLHELELGEYLDMKRSEARHEPLAAAETAAP